MPTENRSSSTKMVSVKRETISQAAELLQEYNKCSIARELRAILAQPAHPHQGEPAMWANKLGDTIINKVKAHNLSLGGAPAGIATHYDQPLYTHADPGEVERLRAKIEQLRTALKGTQERWAKLETALLAQLAERDALLLEIRGQSGSSWLRGETQHKLDAALSTRAEPSEECAHRFMSLADHPRRCADCDAAEVIAPVERDELMELLRDMTYAYRGAIQAGYDRITSLGGDCDSVDKILADLPAYAKARAALERKPS